MSSRHPERPIRSDLDRFADIIKDGPSVRAAADRMQISFDQANAYMQRLRRRYGG
jgi:hypothetical protein